MHYNMEAMVRFNAQTTGRDKLFRLCQYTSRLVWATIAKLRPNTPSVKKLKDLENSISISRKLLRLGRCVDELHTAMQTIHLPDPTLRITLTFSRIASSLYLLCDHVVWLGRIGLVSVDRNQWSDLSNRFWLYSISMNLVRDVYEIINLLKPNNCANTTHKHSFGHSSRIDVIPPNPMYINDNQYLRTIEWILKHRNVCIDTLKNCCDVWLPMTSLGHTKLSPQTVGLLGLVSSLIAILQVFDYSYRLSPS